MVVLTRLISSTELKNSGVLLLTLRINIDLNPYYFEATLSGRFTAEFIPSL